jgi:hypothetical protein
MAYPLCINMAWAWKYWRLAIPLHLVYTLYETSALCDIPEYVIRTLAAPYNRLRFWLRQYCLASQSQLISLID